MKYLTLLLTCFVALLMSCEDDVKAQQAEAMRAQSYNDSILKILNNNWKFNIPPVNPRIQQNLANWAEWQQFKDELTAAPAGTITSYKQKSKNIADRADQLANNVPQVFDKPQVRSRIAVLITKTKSLYTFTNLDVVQDKKVVPLISSINTEITSLLNQFDELIRRSQVPKEVGEEEMLRALDTVRRANPEAAQQPQPQVQQRPPVIPGQVIPPVNPVEMKRQRMKQLQLQN